MEQLDDRNEVTLRELVNRVSGHSITAVAAPTGIRRSSVYRNSRARGLINQRIAETRLHAEANLVSEVHRLQVQLEALAARVRTQEERLRRLQGRPHTIPS